MCDYRQICVSKCNCVVCNDQEVTIPFLVILLEQELINRLDSRTFCPVNILGLVDFSNKKCGRRVPPTRYAPARLWHWYSILFPELRRGRYETYRRCELNTLTFDLEGYRDCRLYTSWYFVRVPSANFVVWPTRVRHTMWPCWPWPLTLEVMALATDAGLCPPSAHQLWSS